MKSLDVIGISGKAGSGKDFITQNILRPLGYNQISLAWHFKVGLVGEGKASYDEVFNTKPAHVRKALQQKGTEEGRDVYGVDVWCQHLEAWMQLYNEAWGINKFVVADVRFPNEVEFIQKMGGRVLRIHAPDRVENSSLTVEARKHISETTLDDFSIGQFNGFILNDKQNESTVVQQVYEALGVGPGGYIYDDDDPESDSFLDGIINTVRSSFKSKK